MNFKGKKMNIHKKHLLLIISAVFLLLPSAASAQEIKWIDYESGVKISREKNKKMYIYFYSEKCPWCTKMEKDVFSDQQNIALLNKEFTSVKINVSQRPDIVQKYKVEPLPTNIFLESDAVTEIYNRPGYIRKNIFTNILETIRLEKYKK